VKFDEPADGPAGCRSDAAAATKKQTGEARPVIVKKTEQPRRKPTVAKRGRVGSLRSIGVIRSGLKTRKEAPKQGAEGAPEAWLEVRAFAGPALDGLAEGDDIIVLTWLHQARRDVLKVHPRGDKSNPLTGVFATRSPDRPNPVGLHRVTVRQIGKNRLLISPIEAIDGTPVVDIKPVLSGVADF